MSYTRIVCTIGPNSLEEQTLLDLYKIGLRVARLNGSHADLSWHENAINIIRKVLPSVPILLDIPGRKIRTTELVHEPKFSVGDNLILTTDQKHDGTKKVPVNYVNLAEDLSVGDTIMADDGTLSFIVTKIDKKDIHCRAKTFGQLKSRKGINVPYVKLNTPLVTERDKKMIDFARKTKVDFIGLSFVESAAHILAFRKLIAHNSPRIIAKVENQGGMDSVHEIVDAADAIMIDRGDLSVETSLYDITIKQKQIIEAAKQNGRPVIVATEMLHTMIDNPFPTKAEVTDISNAVLDGCSATMLSGETAIGSYANEAVETMQKVIDASETHLNKEIESDKLDFTITTPKAISSVIPILCRTLPITKIIAITRSGYAARMIATHRLKQPVLAVSDDETAARSFNLIGGTTGVYSKSSFRKESTDHIKKVLKMLWKMELIEKDDHILITGISYPSNGTRMNTIQIHEISNLINSQAWLN